MPPALHDSLFVAYVPGLDVRRLPEAQCPYLRDLLDESPTVEVRSLPDVELVPTLITGTLPHEHGVWQVRRRDPAARRRRVRDRLIDLFPDLVTTTFQGLRHAVTNDLDLATIPPRRRRRFELRRFKYERRLEGWLEPSDRLPSIFRILGPSDTRYHLSHRFSRLDRLLPELPSRDVRLEWLELYAFDLTEHWNLDRPEVMAEALGEVDRCIEHLHAACVRSDLGFVLLCDHGQELVRDRIDLLGLLDRGDVSLEDVDWFVEPSYARFWFDSESAREAVNDVLGAHPNVVLNTYREMHAYDICFETPAFGELYAHARPGYVFFPHDFYQPLANLYMGITDPQQRPRIWDPVHRGAHGYLPDAPSESGFLACADDRVEPTGPEMDLVDVAPTLLRLLGEPRPEHMSGSPALERG